MFRYLLVLEDGGPADPGAFVSTEPPGHWEVGAVFTTAQQRFRILAIEGAPENGDDPPSWVAEGYRALWTVEPV